MDPLLLSLRGAHDPTPHLLRLLKIVDGSNIRAGESSGSLRAPVSLTPVQRRALLAVTAFAATSSNRCADLTHQHILAWLRAIPSLLPSAANAEFVEALVSSALSGIGAGMHGASAVAHQITALFESLQLSQLHDLFLRSDAPASCRLLAAPAFGFLACFPECVEATKALPLASRTHAIATLASLIEACSRHTESDCKFAALRPLVNDWHVALLRCVGALVASLPVSTDVRKLDARVFNDLHFEEMLVRVYDAASVLSARSVDAATRSATFEVMVHASVALQESAMFSELLTVLLQEIISVCSAADTTTLTTLCHVLFVCVVDSDQVVPLRADDDASSVAKPGRFIRDRDALTRAVNGLKAALLSVELPDSPQFDLREDAPSPVLLDAVSPSPKTQFSTSSMYVKDALLSALTDILAAEMAEIDAEDVLSFSGCATRDLLTSLSSEMYSLATTGSGSSRLRQRLSKFKSKLKRGKTPAFSSVVMSASSKVGGGSALPDDSADVDVTTAEAGIDKAVAVVAMIARIVCQIDHPLLTYAAGEIFVDHFTRHSVSAPAPGALAAEHTDIKCALVAALADVAVLSSQVRCSYCMYQLLSLLSVL